MAVAHFPLYRAHIPRHDLDRNDTLPREAFRSESCYLTRHPAHTNARRANGTARNGYLRHMPLDIVHDRRSNSASPSREISKESNMSMEEDNKAIVGRWFTSFWGETCDLGIVDAIAAPDMLLKYSLHEPRRGREDIKAFMTGFRAAFPDLNFWGTANLIAEGDVVVGQWEGGGTHSGPAFGDFLAGSLPQASGRKMHFTGTTVLRLKDGKIIEELGLDDGVTALSQLGLIKRV
jgi:predicted ester cyclase